jgi:hypothetical protein
VARNKGGGVQYTGVGAETGTRDDECMRNIETDKKTHVHLATRNIAHAPFHHARHRGAVEGYRVHQRDGVANHGVLHSEIESGIARHRGRGVCLDKPRPALLVDEHVVAKHLCVTMVNSEVGIEEGRRLSKARLEGMSALVADVISAIQSIWLVTSNALGW